MVREGKPTTETQRHRDSTAKVPPRISSHSGAALLTHPPTGFILDLHSERRAIQRMTSDSRLSEVLEA